MAEELRLAFILLGSLAIGAVILHGVWTVRKAVNEERKLTKQAKQPEPEMDLDMVDEEVQSLKLKQMEMDFAELQAEENGLPVVNVDVDSIYKEDNVNASTQIKQQDTETEGDASSMSASSAILQPDGAGITPQNELFENDSKTNNNAANFGDDVASSLSVANNNAEPQFGDWTEEDDTPVIGDISASHVADEKGPAFNAGAELDDASLANVQKYEPKFESPVSHQKPTTSARRETVTNQPGSTATEKEQPASEAPQQVLMLFVDKSDGDVIEGAKLLPLLLTLGFKFGEMDFFHRHVHNSGQGEILFSLANMFNPGTFDPDKMEQFSTRGLTIFMTLPNALEPLQTFNMMHNAAKKIADEFGAKVLDEQRRPLDVSIVRGYVERIRKFKG